MASLEKPLRWSVLVDVLLLVGALVTWHFAVNGPSWLAGLAVVPLLLTVPGLARGNRQTFRWTMLLLVPYLTYAVMESVANPPARIWAAVAAGLSFCAFVSLGLYLRLAR